METALRSRLIAVIAAALITVAGLAWFGTGSDGGTVAAVTAAPISGPASTPRLTVHVSGAVARPGLVEVPAGARVADALAAAGGAVAGADLGGLNLAAAVRDGSRIAVPALGESSATSGSGTDDGLVSINLGAAEDLERLPGVGTVLALRILEYRDEHGPFTEVEDLLGVPGIGEAKLEALRGAVQVP